MERCPSHRDTVQKQVTGVGMPKCMVPHRAALGHGAHRALARAPASCAQRQAVERLTPTIGPYPMPVN